MGLLFLFYASPTDAWAQEDRVLLVVFAHPDDEITVGPSLARYAREGADVHLVIAVRPEMWAPETNLEPGDEIARVRAAEARCSASALDIHPPIMLNLDGGLGRLVSPPWEVLGQLEDRLTEVFEEVRPDVVVTFGPEGGYGHPDHRLVGAVVTQIVQRNAQDEPPNLFYIGFPSERLAGGRLASDLYELPWQTTASEYLTVRVTYTDADLQATQNSFGCYESQFSPRMLQAFPQELHEMVWQGQVFFRPWFGAMRDDDLFTLPRD